MKAMSRVPATVPIRAQPADRFVARLVRTLNELGNISPYKCRATPDLGDIGIR